MGSDSKLFRAMSMRAEALRDKKVENLHHGIGKVIVCDIDGTVSKIGSRLQYIAGKIKHWDRFYQDSFNDEPIREMCDMIYALSTTDYFILFLTGRREDVRDKTNCWLRANVEVSILCRDLYMRKYSDHRSDTITKPELLEQFFADYKLKKENIAFIVEDRKKMVEEWRRLGYRCLQVDEGNF